MCQMGQSTSACGKSGGACTSCSVNQTCTAGSCVTMSSNGGGSSGTGGGSAAGGSAAGGSAAGGSTAGGSTAGGAAAGGSAGGDAGGSAAGGDAAGGSAGGGSGADVTPPTILSTTPQAGASNVPGGTDAGITVTIDFSEPIDTASFMATFAPTTALLGTPSFSNNNASASVTTAAPLNPGATYTVSVVARDLANNALASPTMFGFTTLAVVDTTPPTVTATTPANAATNVTVAGLTVSATFSEPVAPSTIVTTLNAPFDLGTPTMTMGNRVATWSMPSFDDGGVATFQASTTYNVTVEATDVAGNAMAMPYPFSFTTASPPDTTPPTLVSILPADSATAVPTNSSVVMTFSEPMNTATVEAGLRFNGSVRTGTYTWSNQNRVVRFSPTATWTASTSYTASFMTAPTDVAGNPMASVSRSFTTGTGTDLTAATVTNRSPNTGAMGVPTRTGCDIFFFRSDTTVQLTFSSPVDPVTTAAAFTLLDGTTPVQGTVTLSAAGTVLTFSPRTTLAFNTTYTVRLGDASTTAKDLQGNNITNVLYTFTTMREITRTIFINNTASGRILSAAVSGQQTVASNVAIRVGEFNTTVRSRGHATFDLSVLPSNLYCVNNATLTFEQTGVNGTPYGSTALGDVIAEVVNMGVGIDATDYSAAALSASLGNVNATVLSSDPSFGLKSAQVAGQVRLALAQAVPGNVRWRLRFSNDAMSAGAIDNASFQNTTAGARLVIRYEAP